MLHQNQMLQEVFVSFKFLKQVNHRHIQYWWPEMARFMPDIVSAIRAAWAAMVTHAVEVEVLRDS
jgi:hypothetical protein